MKSLSQTQEPSVVTPKRIAIAIAILALCGLALWGSLEVVLRLTSGQG
jgi:hypothetical protein